MVQRLAINGGPRTVPEGIGKPWPSPSIITDDDRKAVIEALDEAVLAHWSRQVELLEEDWARYVGTRYCLATNSGTAALHMAVAAAGVEPGDEVITSAYSFHASASCILHHNGIPIFADIDPKTFNIDPKKVEEKITDKTKAIIVVHLFGLPAEMDEINSIARKYDLVVIEDAAHAHGAEYKGRKTGNLGDMAAFSLNANKNLFAGEGGLFTTNRDEYYDMAQRVRTFGEIVRRDGTRSGDVFGLGWMYKPNAITAALARSLLKRLDEYNAIRIKNCEYLTSHLSKFDGIQVPYVPPHVKHVYNTYVIRLRPEELDIDIPPRKLRDAMQMALNAEGVPFKPYYRTPIPASPLYQRKVGYGKGCPWTCPHSRKEIEYSSVDYQEALRLCDDHLALCDRRVHGHWPPNDLKLMDYYIEAFEKIFDNLDQVIELAKKI